MKTKREPLTLLSCALFMALTVLFFSPMEVFLANMKEITVPFRNVWWLQLLFSLLVSLLLTGLLWFLPGRIGLAAAGGVFAVGLAAYLQAMFLNGGMPAMVGERMNVTPGQIKLNLALWILLIIAIPLAVFLLSRRRLPAVRLALRCLAAFLVAVQAVGFVTTALTTDTSELVLEHNLSKEGEFELSPDTNVVEFVIDSADTAFFRQMLDRYPEMNDILSGWTWYPDAASEYSRTFPAFTYLLTGQPCRFDRLFQQWVEESFSASAFLPGINAAGTDIRVFTSDPQFVAHCADPYIANSVPFLYSDIRNLRLPILEKNLIKMALYKSMPYQFKTRFTYEIAEINSDSFFPAYSSRDDDFHRDLTSQTMTVNDSYAKAYRVYYLLGIHPGVNWDENLQVTGPGWDERLSHLAAGEEMAPPDLADSLRGCFRNVETYIEKMKELGVYDKATIIVTADHGRAYLSGNHKQLNATSAISPVVLVKYPQSDLSKPLQTNSAPVSHQELFATVEKGLSVPVSGTGSGLTF